VFCVFFARVFKVDSRKLNIGYLILKTGHFNLLSKANESAIMVQNDLGMCRMKRIVSLITAVVLLLNSIFAGVWNRPKPVVQFYPETQVSGPVTTYQTGGAFTEPLYIPSDSVMVYTLDPGNYANWANRSDIYTIDMMIAINRADTSYVDAPPGHRDEIQMRKDGSLLNHPSSASVFYMVPTEGFIDNLCNQLEACIKIKAPGMIALEEPEIFDDGCYSTSFKTEWQNYYGEVWKDPDSSPIARYQTSALIVHLFERAITQISTRVKAICPETKIYIATHSTVNYDDYGITAGIDRYAALPGVDGIIGQTWSDTARMKLKYNGTEQTDVYSYAALEYASYMDTVEDIDFYALADSKADNPDLSWADYRYLYHQTIAASLMQPEIHMFEVLPWPDRSFLAAPDTYKTEQLNVFAALKGLSGKASELTAGTAKIALGISDTMSWHDEKTSKQPLQAFEGLSIPLIKDGIPLKIKSLDFIKTAQDLADIDVLILSYEIMKPAKEQTNIAIAEWVKSGGVLLYVGGHDAVEKMPDAWWSPEGTPLKNLFNHLGLADIEVNAPKTLPNFFKWVGAGLDTFDEIKINLMRLRFGDKASNAAFTGNVNTVLKSGSDSIGISQSVGNGRVLAFGFPAYLTSTLGGAGLTRSLVKYALTYTGSEYNRQNLVSINRGGFVSAHAFNKKATIEGKFIDIFDSELGIVFNPTIEKDGSCLLFDIADLDLSVPRLAFTGGKLTGNPVETAGSTQFTVTGPSLADISTRLVCAQGTYPQSVSVIREGKAITPYIKWDASTSSLLLQFEGAVSGVAVEVTWLGNETDISNEKMNNRIVIPTNSSNFDAAYIHKNTAFANDSLRYADGAAELIYKFNINEFSNPTITLQVLQNYLIDVSADGVNYTVTHDYSLINPVHLTTGGNDVLLIFDPDDYSAEQEFYIRIRNTDPTKGWGGSVRTLIIRQFPA
jgi:hypothetical protein